jgi:hypothetical protein
MRPVTFYAEVLIHVSGQEEIWCNTQGKLAQALGVENLVFDHGSFAPLSKNLCAINLEATARKAGFLLSETGPDGEKDPFDYHFYPIRQEAE